MQENPNDDTSQNIPVPNSANSSSSSAVPNPARPTEFHIPIQHPQPQHSSAGAGPPVETASQTPQPPPATSTPKSRASPHHPAVTNPQSASLPPATSCAITKPFAQPRYTMAAVATHPTMPNSLPGIHNLPAFSPVEAGMTTHSHPQAFAAAAMQPSTASLPQPTFTPKHAYGGNGSISGGLPIPPSASASSPDTFNEAPLEIGLSTIDQHASLHQASLIHHGEMGYFQGQYGQFSHSSDGQTWFSPLTPATVGANLSFFQQSHLPRMQQPFTHGPAGVHGPPQDSMMALAPPVAGSGSMTRSTSNPTLAASPRLDQASSMMTRSYTSIKERPFVYLQQAYPHNSQAPPQSAASQYVSPYSSGIEPATDDNGRHQNLARALMTPATLSATSTSSMSSPSVPSSGRRKSSVSADSQHQMMVQHYGHYWHDGHLYQYPFSQQEALAQQQHAQIHATGAVLQSVPGANHGKTPAKSTSTTSFQAAFQGKSHAQTNAFSYHSIDTEDETDIDRDDMVKREDATEAGSPEAEVKADDEDAKVGEEGEREPTPIVARSPSIDSLGRSTRESPSPDPDAMSTDEYKPHASKKKKTARKVSGRKTISKRRSASAASKSRQASATSAPSMSPSRGNSMASVDEDEKHEVDPADIVYTDNADDKVSAEVKRICSVCGMTEPPSWRRSLLTPAKILCNRCGIFERAHGKPRPTNPAELGYPPLPEKSRAGKRNGRKPPPKRMRGPRKRPEELLAEEAEQRVRKVAKPKKSKRGGNAITAPSTPPSYAEQRRMSFGGVTVFEHLTPGNSSRSPFTTSPGTAKSTPISTPYDHDYSRQHLVIYEPLSGLRLQSLQQ